MKARRTKLESRESEAALIIRSERSHLIADKIASLGKVGEYCLEPKKPQRIRDILFDTPTRELGRQRLALRIRRVNGKTLITFKGPSQSNGWGGRVRTEIELPWSEDSLKRVLSELKNYGIVTAGQTHFGRDLPIETMQRVGFVIVQDRSTHRRIRDVIAKSRNGNTVLAEVAIDSVDYHFQKIMVRIYEIEVEAKSNSAELDSVVKTLENKYRPALRQARSKLAIGNEIARLIAAGALKLIQPNNTLGVDQLDEIMGDLAYA